MSIDIMNRIWWREDLDTMEKFVAIALANMANDDDFTCYPSVATIARVCGCVPRTVQNCTKRLEQKGLIRIYQRADRSNYYVFSMANLPIVSRPMRGRKEKRIMVDQANEPDLFAENEAAMSGVQQIHPTPEPNSETGESGSITGAGDSPRNHIEPSEETSKETTGALVVRVGDSDLRDFIAQQWEYLKNDFPNVAGLRQVTDTYLKNARIRAKQHANPGETELDVWRMIFEEIRKSPFLTGQVPPGPGRTSRFRLSLAKLLKPNIFGETINGTYSGNSDEFASRVDASTGEIIGPARAATRKTAHRIRQAKERAGQRSDPAQPS